MTALPRRPLLRWLVPVIVALVLAASGAVAGAITAAARSGLPHRSASQLLVDVQKARLDGLSGTVVQKADLGLPALPGASGGGSSDLASLVSGSHTLRVWYAGPNRFRLALLGSLGESDVVRNGTDLWTWSSTDKSADHHVVPLSDHAPDSLGAASSATPQQAAEAALRAISPSTKVSTAGTAVVAGRSAYELVLRPREAETLIGSVRIAIDGRTHIPTRVEVFAAHASKPAVDIGFTSFDPTPPAASVFRFDPPPGTHVTEGSADRRTGAGRTAPRPSSVQPKVVGSAWTSVLVARLPHSASNGASNSASNGASDSAESPMRVLQALPRVHGRWGSGHLLRGTLFSVLVTDDGRLALGAVPPDRLYAALRQR